MNPEEVLIIHNALSREATQMAAALVSRLGTRLPMRPAEGTDEPLSGPASLVVTVGGDGTILRAAQQAAPLGVPLLGVNLGRLGFLTEVEAADALDLVPRYLQQGFAWVQERSMLQVQVRAPGQESHPTVHALNDVVVGRGPTARLPRILVRVDSADLAIYSADAVIVASATGSTGYALSAGGPILYPTSSDMVLKAVAPHGDLAAAVIVPADALVELSVQPGVQGYLSADGYWDLELRDEHTVRVTKSPYTARFLRAGTPERFYETLLYRLHRGPALPAPLPQLSSEKR
jgi:NAD+ kinase